MTMDMSFVYINAKKLKCIYNKELKDAPIP